MTDVAREQRGNGAGAVTDVDAAARALEGASALDILTWASKHIPKLTFATGLGAEDCVVIDLIGKHALPIAVFTLDTGVLFAETRELWRALEGKYGIAIRGVVPAQTIDEQAAAHGAALWEREPDRCCELRKIEPLTRELKRYDAWITAIRREQTPERANARVVETDRRFGLIKINPLAAWTHDDVWAHIYANDVPYNVLHERGYPSIGCQPCTSPVVPGEDLRSGRWRGSHKKECGLHVVKETAR
jgi:thioredoxin-dependent adenylylsulfate APS reductase